MNMFLEVANASKTESNWMITFSRDVEAVDFSAASTASASASASIL